MNHKEKYYQQDLGQVWAHDAYGKYIDAQWSWIHWPFDNDFTRPNRSFYYTVENPVENKSIVEIGSAMGQGYQFLKNSRIIDTRDYTGIEVSDKGFSKSCERFPDANWVQADFTKYEFNRNYDYGYERHAIHHMPDPVEQIKKVLKHINISFCTTFVGCVEEGTISDLDKGFHNNGGKGLVYFDIISVSEIVDVALEEGFNHIRILYWGKQESISTNPNDGQYMDPELVGQRDYARYTVRFTKCPQLKTPLVYSVLAGKLGGLKRWLESPAGVIRVKNHVNQFRSKAENKKFINT